MELEDIINSTLEKNKLKLQLMAVCYRGNIHPELGVNTPDAYHKKQDRVLNGKEGGYPPLTPVMEKRLCDGKIPELIEVEMEDDFSKEDIDHAVLDSYRELIDEKKFSPGENGDLVELLLVNSSLFITGVYRKEFEKYVSAVDPVIVCRDSEDFYLVTGDKGGPVLPGGIVEVVHDENGVQQAECNVQTVLHEMEEEMNIKASPVKKLSLTDYDADEIDITVDFGDFEAKGTIYRLKTIKSTDLPRSKGGEIMFDGSSKRVHKTTAYLVLIDFGNKEITPGLLDNYVEAGDDNLGTNYFRITDYLKNHRTEELARKVNFKTPHHAEFLEPMMEKLQVLLTIVK